MKLTYDPRYNVAYIRFCDRPEQVETVHLGDDLNVDLSPDGSIYGIELLNANEQLSADGGKLLVINQSTGKQAEVPFHTR